MPEPPAPSEFRDPDQPRTILPVALFLLTFLTTTASGAIRQHPGADFPIWQILFPVAAIRPISDGLSYSVPLMLILLCHELGHYFAARAYGVPASLPFFIPLPPLFGLGTMGAVIGMRQVTADRRKLIDIGAAGPLAGLVVAVPVIIYGLSLSPVSALHPGGLQEGNSILYGLLKLLTKGAWLPDGTRDVMLHPTAFAGWTGLLVTMINLLPIGQLDGGHIATAYFGNGYNRFARRLHQALPLVATLVFAWVTVVVRHETRGTGRATMGDVAGIAFEAALPWILWWGMVALVRRASGSGDHPPVEPRPLGKSRRALFWLMVVVFALLLMPVPMRKSLAGVDAPATETERENATETDTPAAETTAAAPAPIAPTAPSAPPIPPTPR
jgi:membrane-associated protease RseP (regulator of RpoE activity)